MTNKQYDVVVVGSGFAGLYSIQRLLQRHRTVIAFEAGDGVGGTWHWNRYPGARCDVQSMEYSYGFDNEMQQEWQWSERYATQPEILQYANHVADRFALRAHIKLNTRVISAHYLEDECRWRICTDQGDEVSSQFCIMATGCLSSTNLPNFPGMDDFQGETYHTGQWPKSGVDFAEKHVGIIGTGSSAMQSIPVIAEQCESLTVFQRTPNYSVPAYNQRLTPEWVAAIKSRYVEFRAQNRQMFAAFGSDWEHHEDSIWDADDETIQARFEQKWAQGGLGFTTAFGDIGTDREANAVLAEFVRNKINSQVQDPATARLLCPDTIIGCKRLCVDTNYYATFNRANVKLVSVKEKPVKQLTTKGLIVGDQEYALDVIIFATGFDAMTGTLLKIDIRGREYLSLTEKWQAGPKTYLGISVHSFPNLFTISGPGSPSVLSNMIMTIEQHVEWVTDCIEHLLTNQLESIEAEQQAEEDWVNKVNKLSDQTLFPGCNSWYLGANVPGKPRIFMPFVGGVPAYDAICRAVAESGYQEGFKQT